MEIHKNHATPLAARQYNGALTHRRYIDTMHLSWCEAIQELPQSTGCRHHRILAVLSSLKEMMLAVCCIRKCQANPVKLLPVEPQPALDHVEVIATPCAERLGDFVPVFIQVVSRHPRVFMSYLPRTCGLSHVAHAVGTLWPSDGAAYHGVSQSPIQSTDCCNLRPGDLLTKTHSTLILCSTLCSCPIRNLRPIACIACLCLHGGNPMAPMLYSWFAEMLRRKFISTLRQLSL